VLRGTTLVQLPEKRSPLYADNGATGGDYTCLYRLGSHPQLQGEFSLFLYRLAATAGSLGTEIKTYYSSSMLLERNLNDICRLLSRHFQKISLSAEAGSVPNLGTTAQAA
jgi:hypothetical protein